MRRLTRHQRVEQYILIIDEAVHSIIAISAYSPHMQPSMKNSMAAVVELPVHL